MWPNRSLEKLLRTRRLSLLLLLLLPLIVYCLAQEENRERAEIEINNNIERAPDSNLAIVLLVKSI